MGNLDGFDAGNVEPFVEHELIPDAKYPGVLRASGIRPTKRGTGTYLDLEFVIIEGLYKDRVLWARINRTNPSSKAVEIGDAELSSLCRAVGVPRPADSLDLHDRPLLISVGHENYDGKVRNIIKGFYPINGNTGQPAKTQPAPTAPQPWRRS